MVLALACDLTRVATSFWFAMGPGGVTFRLVGHKNRTTISRTATR